MGNTGGLVVVWGKGGGGVGSAGDGPAMASWVGYCGGMWGSGMRGEEMNVDVGELFDVLWIAEFPMRTNGGDEPVF
jgi:hypothetical protein